MWSMVLGDYFRSFTWRNIMDSLKYRLFTFMLIYISYSPFLGWILGNREDLETVEGAITFLCVMLPLLFSAASMACFPAGLSKIMYLCPMNGASRREYLNKKCMVRMAVPTIVSLISGIIYVILGGYYLYGLAIVLNHSALHICAACDTNMHVWGTQDDKGNYVIDQESKRGFLEAFIRMAVYLMAVMHMYLCSGEGSLVASLWMLGIALAVEVPMVIWFVKHWPEYVEKELFYETTDRMCNGKGPVKQ